MRQRSALHPPLALCSRPLRSLLPLASAAPAHSVYPTQSRARAVRPSPPSADGDRYRRVQTLKECKLEDGGTIALIYKKSADVSCSAFACDSGKRACMPAGERVFRHSDHVRVLQPPEWEEVDIAKPDDPPPEAEGA